MRPKRNTPAAGNKSKNVAKRNTVKKIVVPTKSSADKIVLASNIRRSIRIANRVNSRESVDSNHSFDVALHSGDSSASASTTNVSTQPDSIENDTEISVVSQENDKNVITETETSEDETTL